jgi:hypothetical protein
MSSLLPLLNEDDEGIGELDEDEEITLSPKGSGFRRKIIEPISVKPKIRFQPGGNNKKKNVKK